jgi:hypothetical protein
MKQLPTNAACVMCLAGLAVIQFGWLVYPALGTMVAMLNAAFVLTCLAAYVLRCLIRWVHRRLPSGQTRAKR